MCYTDPDTPKSPVDCPTDNTHTFNNNTSTTPWVFNRLLLICTAISTSTIRNFRVRIAISCGRKHSLLCSSIFPSLLPVVLPSCPLPPRCPPGPDLLPQSPASRPALPAVASTPPRFAAIGSVIADGARARLTALSHDRPCCRSGEGDNDAWTGAIWSHCR